MTATRPSHRELRREIGEILVGPDTAEAMRRLGGIEDPRVPRLLLSFLSNADEEVRERVVQELAARVATLADRSPEEARNLVRRLMWILNEESGSSGWGAPEALGEILARHEGLAREYAGILVSYARRDGNYLEHPPLQRGLLWGIGRLALVRPELLKAQAAGPHLIPFLEAGDPVVRGLAAWCIGLLDELTARERLAALAEDDAETEVRRPAGHSRRRVRELAREALARLMDVERNRKGGLD